MQSNSRRILFSGLILLLSGLSSTAIYASATTFLNHTATITHLQGVGGGFTDNTGLWTVMTDPALNTSGLVVYSFDRASAGTSQANPSTFFQFCVGCPFGNLALVSNGVAAGDWALRIALENTTIVPLSTTWSINVVILEDGFITQIVTLYFKSGATLPSIPSGCEVVAIIDMGFAQTLSTPFAYTVTVKKV